LGRRPREGNSSTRHERGNATPLPQAKLKGGCEFGSDVSSGTTPKWLLMP